MPFRDREVTIEKLINSNSQIDEYKHSRVIDFANKYKHRPDPVEGGGTPE